MIIIPYYLYSVDVLLYYRYVIMYGFYSLYEYSFEHMSCIKILHLL